MVRKLVRLHIITEKTGPVSEIKNFLSDLENAYLNLLALELLTDFSPNIVWIDEDDEQDEQDEDYDFEVNDEEADDDKEKAEKRRRNQRLLASYRRLRSDLGRRKKFRPLNPIENVYNISLPSEQLLLTSVVIESPGFWEFLGTLNPLETIRNYIKDRHERKKDTDYRNEYEKEKLILEVQKERLNVLDKQYELLKKYGYSEEDIRKVLVVHGFNPLEKLNKYQDSGIIEDADIIEEVESPDFVNNY